MSNGPVPTLGNISIRRNQGLVARDNSLVARGLQDTAQLGKPSAEDVFARGLAYHEKGDYDKAIAEYTEAIRLDQSYAKAYYYWGLAYRSKRDYEKAITDYTEAVRLDPTDAEVYNKRGIAYHATGDYDKAIADHTEAIRLNRQTPRGITGGAAPTTTKMTTAMPLWTHRSQATRVQGTIGRGVRSPEKDDPVPTLGTEMLPNVGTGSSFSGDRYSASYCPLNPSRLASM